MINKIAKTIKNVILFNPICMTPFVAKRIVKLVARTHNFCYRLLSRYAKTIDGVHPKHEIVNYFEFFINNISPHGNVLDVGCSSGEMLEKIAQRTSGYVVGIEIEEPKVKSALHRLNTYQNAEVIHADIWNYKPDREFDFLTLSNVLEHLERRVELLGHLVSSIRPKVILIRVPMITRGWEVEYKRRIGVEWRLDSTHKIEYTEEEFRNEIDLAGLKIEKFFIRWGEIYAVVVPK